MKNIWNHSAYLPSIPEEFRISLGEGQTPLVRSKFIGPSVGLNNLYFKLENLNPTGSYKDRFAAVFISGLRQKQQNLCIATSSGNTGAALSAYSGAANIKCFLAIVEGAPLSKITQMQLYGADVYMIRGFGKEPGITADTFNMLEKIAKQRGIPLPVSSYSYCAEGMQGVQTIAYELLNELNGAIGQIFSPSGGGGLTLAIAKGVLAHSIKKGAATLPKVNCVQPSGNNTIAGRLRDGFNTAQDVSSSTTQISGLQVPNILDGTELIKYCKMLKGNGYVVEDEDIFKYQCQMAQKEGIFCEPAGAVALTGLMDAVKKNEVNKDENIVCIVSGTGFKDMSSISKNFNLTNNTMLNNSNALIKILEKYN